VVAEAVPWREESAKQWIRDMDSSPRTPLNACVVRSSMAGFYINLRHLQAFKLLKKFADCLI